LKPVGRPGQHVGHGRGDDRSVADIGIAPKLHGGAELAQPLDERLRDGGRNERIGHSLHDQDRGADRLPPGRVPLQEGVPGRAHEHRGVDVVGQGTIRERGGDGRDALVGQEVGLGQRGWREGESGCGLGIGLAPGGDEGHQAAMKDTM
jgi:hypothetical protein